ncbi:VOC family protein [Ideonella sp.]|jgi:predicted enzyme related to lactoylglutathione lyase|uniref:VOC family protein n=1 Tax=Ideonella sp. TaxID=1929293 RepID=UPI0037BFBB22
MMLNTARVFVSDLSGAHGFYANKLGLALKFGSPEMGYCVYDAGACQLVVEPVAADAPPDDLALVGRFTGLSFKVSQLAQDFDRLKNGGVVFTSPPKQEAWGGLVATLLDPAGNELQLCQYPDAL